MKSTSNLQRIVLVVGLTAAMPASATSPMEMAYANAIADAARAPRDLTQANSEFYLRQIDLAISISDSATAAPLKKLLLKDMIREARRWKNISFRQDTDLILGELDTFESQVDAERFWIFSLHLSAIRSAIQLVSKASR